MANAVNDDVLAANLENGSMQAVKHLTKLKRKIVALPWRADAVPDFSPGT
jgi:hypothetical protein